MMSQRFTKVCSENYPQKKNSLKILNSSSVPFFTGCIFLIPPILAGSSPGISPIFKCLLIALVKNCVPHALVLVFISKSLTRFLLNARYITNKSVILAPNQSFTTLVKNQFQKAV